MLNYIPFLNFKIFLTLNHLFIYLFNKLKRSETQISGDARFSQKKEATEKCDSEKVNYLKNYFTSAYFPLLRGPLIF